jgi:tetratricopeptide (TPR) repeat protein
MVDCISNEANFAVGVQRLNRKWTLRSHVAVGFLLMAVAGCNWLSGQGDSSEKKPVDLMRQEISLGHWEKAWEFADEVEREYADDALMLTDLAKVAFASQRPNDAARLLVAACRADGYRDEERNDQAVIAITSVGKLFDAIDFLSTVVDKQPEQFKSRRLLFDLLIGTENRHLAIAHGRYLIRQRRFDLELLTSFSHTDLRTLDTAPLNEMVKRNSADRRPLIGEARALFDQGKFAESIEMSREILALHPNDVPAQVLQGQSLVSLGRFSELDVWATNLQGDYKAHPGYWMVLGDWATANQRPQEAARAYWEAIQCDADILEIWVRLRNALTQSPASLKLPTNAIASVDQRIDQLSRFYQAKKQFIKTGSNSRSLAIAISSTLVDLGRLWEAEAWAAVALSFPEEPNTDVASQRNSILPKLKQDTPWQLVDSHPEFQLELEGLSLPALAFAKPSASGGASSDRLIQSESVIKTHFILEDEAVARGLNFHGKTGDQVAGPGVPFYQTLGCGGGTIDYDLDGWPDLYLCAAGGKPPEVDSEPNRLMRNFGGTFRDVTDFSATGDRGFSQGVAIGDLNEDGFQDLLVLNYGMSKVYINQGEGSFVDQSSTWLMDLKSQWSASGAIADINLDGLADAVVVNYCAGLEPVTKVCGDPKDAPGGVPRACSPMAFAGEHDAFLEGLPTGGLADRTSQWEAIPSVVGRGLGITVGQFDGEQGIDLFIANDMTNNHYWTRAVGDDFKLSESSIARGLAGDARSIPQGSMGIATADIDRDGDIDFYVTNFSSEYNTYHVQNSAGMWRDQTAQSGLVQPTMPMVGFGTQATDLDNDGVLELIVSNGHVDSYDDISKVSPYAQPMQVFRQREVNKFESVGAAMPGEYMKKPHVGRALWTIDADRDRRLDFVVTHQTEPVSLLVNRTPSRGRGISLFLVGTRGSRMAVGAVVKVTAGTETWTAATTSGDGYLSSNDRTLHFGLGEIVPNVDVEITWPSGDREWFSNLSCDSDWLLVELQGSFELTVPTGSPPPK